MACIKIKDLTYYYPDSGKPAIKDINLDIYPGEFVLIIGGSGSGKSTLLKALSGLIPEFYGGKFAGNVRIADTDLRKMKWEDMVQKVGMVGQDPENQLVMNNVEHELAFGLENIGMPQDVIKRRVMEIARGLGISELLDKAIPELSSGQKQKVALGSVLTMHPEILILDEPTSQLDPVSSEELLSIVRSINEENGITVVMVEQRLERCFQMADRVIVMDKGRIVLDHDCPEEAAQWAAKNHYPFVPPIPKLFANLGFSKVPLTVKQGRKFVKPYVKQHILQHNKGVSKVHNTKRAENKLVDIKNLWFTYENGTEALKNVNLELSSGDFLAILGENAAGKTTLLKIMSGMLKPGRGKAYVSGKDTTKAYEGELAGVVGYLSQNPNDYLSLPTVREELVFTLKTLNIKDHSRADKMLKNLKLMDYARNYPRDLSTGERQRVALASILVAEPKLILLDEPTRGLDYQLKKELGDILKQLQNKGCCVVVVTHDVEFAAEYANKVALMAKGSIVDMGNKHRVLSNTIFYSTQVSKLFKNICDNVLTLQEAEKSLISMVKLRPTKVYGLNVTGDKL